MSLYELAILGAATADERQRLTATVREMVDGFALGDEVVVHDGASVGGRDRRAAFAAAYFGGESQPDLDAVAALVRESAPVIPTVPQGAPFTTLVPAALQAANGLYRRADDPAMAELAAALLECAGLLRRQRRVFVSYRRTESRAAALQLHDLLVSRGFDVFLDTHDIRPGDPFQDVLWHRLVDSDVMVMLDTPSYFESRWTRQEIGRALAKEIQVLRVVWPGHTPTRLTDLAETMYLDPADLGGADGPIAAARGDEIALRVERLRSRSIAARYRTLTSKLRADAEKIGATVEAVGAHRALAVRLLDDRLVWAYPIVGVPTAELLNDVAEKAERARPGATPILVYDHLGIRDAWMAHLKWLDRHIRAVRAVQVAEAGWRLAAWED